MKRVLLALALLVGASCMYASSDKEMDRFVSSLMKKMTLREKLGQLNLQPGSDATTGGAMKTEFGQLVADGEMGAVLNVMGKDVGLRVFRHLFRHVGVADGGFGSLDVLGGTWNLTHHNTRSLSGSRT